MTHLIHEKIKFLEAQLRDLDSKKSALQEELKNAHAELAKLSSVTATEVHNGFSSEEKIKIFMGLFRGRTDVFPKRWDNVKTAKSGYSPACFNEWVRGTCNKPRIKCSECPNQAFTPLTEGIVRKHLGGEDFKGSKRDHTIGIYPMLADDTCWFLAVDLDKDQWQRDAAAFIKTCQQKSIPYALEKSRSGNGAHIWIFFDKPILASHARKLGAALLTETMDNCPEIGFESYDRFFPNQDTLPSGGFGNLIALPLQRFPRDQGNSVFLDDNFNPHLDQWVFLQSVSKMSEEAVNSLVEDAVHKGKVLGVRMPAEEDFDAPWDMKPSRKVAEIPINEALPKSINIVVSNQIFIEKQNLPPVLINKLLRLAAFQNPEFYKNQAMRLPTFGKPRIIACAEDFQEYIGLPRGCFDEVKDLLDSLSIEVIVDDKKFSGKRIKVKFLGELTDEQEKSAKKLSQHDIGVLAATTAFGKTVVGAHMIAKRKASTLIIVHRRQLLDQWIERLKVFLDLNSDQIGMIGGGKYKPSGVVDVAIIQSLIKSNVVNDVVAEYGHVIVDECHHLSAVSFEQVIRACKAKYVLGLTATATRKDGHHPIIFMQCGPIRYKVDAKKQALLRPFNHKIIFKYTAFNLITNTEKKPDISHIYSEIINDHQRNVLIIEDVLQSLKLGCSPLILTQRKEHAAFFEQHLTQFCQNVIVMVGGQNAKKRAEIKLQLETLSDDEERVIIATGSYIGEGFDDKRLDTLFLTMPISWHGTLAQYAGRLHRAHAHKKEVVIYDYVDNQVAMLAKMAEKRLKGYSKIGYVF
ncbi:MAG: DEAD/DEAH box helicase family protein [Gammaproteobacteria bacterium]|jgi:superfamily II DNA or RNA helicase|nr:DEAD/DEAH box helicase family protein [Gammaproteobacteria bacterium]